MRSVGLFQAPGQTSAQAVCKKHDRPQPAPEGQQALGQTQRVAVARLRVAEYPDDVFCLIPRAVQQPQIGVVDADAGNPEAALWRAQQPVGEPVCRRERRPVRHNPHQHPLRQGGFNQEMCQRQPHGEHFLATTPTGQIECEIPVKARARFDQPIGIDDPLELAPSVFGAVRAQIEQLHSSCRTLTVRPWISAATDLRQAISEVTLAG